MNLWGLCSSCQLSDSLLLLLPPADVTAWCWGPMNPHCHHTIVVTLRRRERIDRVRAKGEVERKKGERKDKQQKGRAGRRKEGE